MNIKIYLSGGFRSKWQNKVIKTLNDSPYAGPVDIFNPADPIYEDLLPHEYVQNDLKELDSSDIVFAYLESSNPLALGLNAELGYAKAKGLYIILVEEPRDDTYIRAFNFTRELADVCLGSLSEGIDYLVDRIRI